MSKTVSNKIEKVKDVGASKALAIHQQKTTENDLAEALLLLGGIRAANHIAASLSANTMRALRQFAELKGFEAFGFTRMDDFLQQHPKSPMTKDQYYARLKALEMEGDDTFDLLNSLRIPLSARKALQKGEIAIEGNEVLVGEERIPLTETNRIKNVLKQVADKVSEQQRTIERGKDEIKRLKKERDEAASEAASFGPRATMDFESAVSQSYLTILSAFTELETNLKQLPASRRQEYIAELRPGISLAVENFTLFATGQKATGETADDVLDAAIAAAASDED